MWCEKCHNGNANFKYDHCGHCGSTKLVDKNPLPSKPVRSMRAMNKRKNKKTARNSDPKV